MELLVTHCSTHLCRLDAPFAKYMYMLCMEYR